MAPRHHLDLERRSVRASIDAIPPRSRVVPKLPPVQGTLAARRVRLICRCNDGLWIDARPSDWSFILSGAFSPHTQENTMDKDRIEGAAEQAKGKVKEVAGKVTGDSKLEAEGKADQVAGKVQNAIGGVKDTLRGK
jgi:uncharacterized protein YjbJ (UPF0337 family)